MQWLRCPILLIFDTLFFRVKINSWPDIKYEIHVPPSEVLLIFSCKICLWCKSLYVCVPFLLILFLLVIIVVVVIMKRNEGGSFVVSHERPTDSPQLNQDRLLDSRIGPSFVWPDHSYTSKAQKGYRII